MNALSMPIIPSDTYSPLGQTLDVLLAAKRELRRLRDLQRETPLGRKIERVKECVNAREREVARSKVVLEMLLDGQKTKRVDQAFSLTVTPVQIKVCTCHSTFPDECPNPGPVTYVELHGEVRISVKALSEDK